jgi:redox-sensitive bicupin YhaK (pirin superfamily)
LKVKVPEFVLATLVTTSGLEIIAKQPSRIAIIDGENIGHRYVWWNFVSNRKQRIKQAKQDWAEGRFPLVPGDDAEFIPLPEK